ncbi:hypothetical protein KFE25_014081 [Diacronema lutheri]|uniref:Transmembrane 9 superfamily member n=2 Tax=Diacronema lutheri TaxID=2081491 RepID=A0A8J5XB33_DIALT|nr:hypothetical protein KFE25_014081 [Diacronema lutheri]
MARSRGGASDSPDAASPDASPARCRARRAGGAAACARLAPLVMAAAAMAAATAVPGARAFYLPGVAPREYAQGDRVELKLNKLASTKTQLPYEWYSLPFCRPARIEHVAENLGEILRGDRIENSPYEIAMHVEERCKVLCRTAYTAEQMAQFAHRIAEDYRVNWIVDNLPAATRVVEPPTADAPSRIITIYERGFPLGFRGSAEIPGTTDGVAYVYNHHRLVLKYHTDAAFDGARIVGFEVEPFSVKHAYAGAWPAAADTPGGKTPPLTTCSAAQPVSHDAAPQPVADAGEVVWSYDVQWEYSDVKWASRWDVYLYATDEQIHWFSMVNSLMIVLFLSGMVALIMARTLRRDLSRYNDAADAKEDAAEESGWKLVHGDVFRPPAHFGLLAVYVGTGAQVFGMTFVTMTFALLGFLSPANRGGLMTAMLLLYVFMGMAAGYIAARLYKMWRGTNWKGNTLKTATMYPGIVGLVFFVLNLFIWGQKSSGAVPFGTLFALLLLWFGISVPLVFAGSYFGYKRGVIEQPTRTNQIPRVIPEQPWYMSATFCTLVGGILPFGAVFIELFFILSSIWLHQFYYVFGFLFVVFVILLITCAEITIVMCYFQLCSEDYRWWWRAYLTAGSSGLYLFAYSLVYLATKMVVVRVISVVMYVCYMLIAAYTFFILTGTVGFAACFWFVRTIYGEVKVE